MDLQMTQVLNDEKTAGADDDGLQVGILRVGTTEHSILKGFTKIGRHPAICQIVIDDLSVSKVHAEIQAGCEAIFISDQRSANGTKIKDVSLKPFFYYTINDGDAIYIGTVKAIFTTNKSTAHSPAVVPETPATSRWLSEANTPGVGNTSDCLFNNSSVCQSDDSVVPGTQRKEKSRTFQHPAVPVDRRSGGSNASPLRFRNASVVLHSVSERFGKSEKIDIAKKSQNVVGTDIHDLETQMIEPCSRSPKKANLKGHTQDVADENIHEAETQVLLRPAENKESAKKEKSNKSRINDTAASSSRCDDLSSNFSRDLLMSTSPSPPDSPNPLCNSDNMDESQDLLELCETPLLTKNTKSPENSATKASPIATKVTTNRKKPVVSNRVIADSDDESATDDDLDIDIVKSRPEVNKGNASDTIDDDSATDDEGEFEALAKKSPKEAQKISSKIQGTAVTNSAAQADIFEALTQRVDQQAPEISSAQKTNIFKAAKERRDQIRQIMAQNRNNSVPNIFEAETQQMDCNEDIAVAATTTERRGQSADRDDDVNIYDAPTQRINEELPIVSSAKKSLIPATNLPANVDIYEVATQPMNPDESPASTRIGRNPPKDAAYDTDIDLLPTQVLNVPTSTPATRSRRSNRRNFEKSPLVDVDDGIYLAPTQIVSNADAVADENDRERSAVDGPSLGADEAVTVQLKNSTPVTYSLKLKKQNTKRSPLSGAVDDADSAEAAGRGEENGVTGRKAKKRPAESEDENAGKEKDRCPANLDDTLVRNLGMIHGEEANDRDLAEETTPLMTQNLVDILKPTQSCDSESRDSCDVIVGDVCEATTPKKRKLGSPGTSGFVQAANRSRWSNALPAASSTMREIDIEDEKKTKDASEERQLSEWEDPDSILYGLPEFKISGTLSNPGSPCPSTTSTHSNVVAPDLRENAKPRRGKVSPGPTESSESRKSIAATKSPELDSPVVGKKSRVARRKVPRKIIEEEEEEEDKDQDSDEAFCYNDLKKMADDLLASGSVESTSRPDDNVAAAVEPENFSSTGRPVRHVRKIVTRKNVAVSRQRTRKLPQAPSSLLVTDAKSTRIDDESASTDVESSSVGVSRKSSRLPKSTKSVTSRAKVAATKQGKESQEVEEILAATPKENVSSGSSRKGSVPKVQLTRMDTSSPSPTTGDADFESPKAKWLRRATMTAKELTPKSASPGSAKSRRTISEGVKHETPKEHHKILLTGLSDDYSKVVKKLGGTVVSVPSKATVLITDKARRTYKFLCAIAQGMRVVSVNWLKESEKAGRFLDCDDFILKDPAAEKRFKFQLEKSLQIARTKKFLEGYTIIITPKVNQPEVSELKAMIEASGGRALTRAPAVRAWNAKTVIVSRHEDVTAINALLAKCPKTVKVTVQSTEFILSGILRQEVNLVEHKLDIP